MDIKTVAKSRGLSMTDVAEKMGVGRVTLSQSLAGNPTLRTLQRIADVIGCNVGDFFEDERPKGAAKIICPHCGKEVAIQVTAAPKA